MKTENRRAARVAVDLPLVIESIGQPELKLHPNLAEVYSRVISPLSAGKKFPGHVRDLSTNGVFIAAEPVPLLSRVAFAFELEGFGRVEAIGWALWRRADNCVVPCGDDQPITFPRGFGVLFEAIPLDARIAIHHLTQRHPN